MKKQIVIKTAFFLIVFGIMLSIVQRVLISHGELASYHCISGFYDEKDHSLDAVYIGGSNVWAFWEAPLAWDSYGINVYPFCNSDQPLAVALNVVKEARKTQPDALYIIGTNSFNPITDKRIHFLIDYMPYSLNRFQLINKLCDIINIPFSKRLEFYFPLFRYHSRWDELSKGDFYRTYDGIKGAIAFWGFWDSQDITAVHFGSTNRRLPLPDYLQKGLDDLLDYCDAEGIRVVFVTTPVVKRDDVYFAELNTINDYVKSRGYPCLDMLDCMEEIGLDLETDYYNVGHTNIHGALKTTKYIAEYLIKNYGFRDKRGEAKYSDWDAAAKKYSKIIASHVLDIETAYEKRDYTLPAPKLNNISVNGTTLTLSWRASEGAKGYRIYRKEEESPWNIIAEVDGNTLRYTDKNCTKDKNYTYTVVPWDMAGEEKVWGKFNTSGVKAKALLNAPELISLDKINDGLKITWKKVKGAAGYKVFRRLPDNEWILRGEVENTDFYVDTQVLDNLPFCYTVRSYTIDKDKRKIDGIQNQIGLLYLPELTMTTVVAAANNGDVTLTWDTVEGMNGYKVYRNGELITELPASAMKFTDKPGDGRYTYRVEAFFKFGSDVYTFNLNNAFEWVDCK